jgi:type II secretory pathway pseudopilin PulG
MTLTELLVVVSIVVLLSSMLIPLLQPVLRGQRVREAARQLNVYLAGAQARAVEQGRPVGVWIERGGHEPTDALNLWYTSYRVNLAEQPEAYTGDLYESRVRIRPNAADPTVWEAWYDWDPNNATLRCCDNLTPAMQQAVAMNDPHLAIALPGDMIRFNGRGPSYVIDQIDNFKITFIVPPNLFDDATKFMRPPPPAGPTAAGDIMAYQPGVSFEIFRRPMKVSSSPLELPRNTGIDLSLSGYEIPYNSPYNLLPAYTAFIPDPLPLDDPNRPLDARFREISPEYDIVIMFKPEGGVDRIYYIAHELMVPSFWEVPQGMVRLLVSRDDQIARNVQGSLNIDTTDMPDVVKTHFRAVVGPLGEANLRDQDNIWLSISTLTGRIQSSPNGDGFADAYTGVPLVQLPLAPTVDARRGYLANARRFATTGQSMGGQ